VLLLKILYKGIYVTRIVSGLSRNRPKDRDAIMYSVKKLLNTWYINVAKNILVVMEVSEKESNEPFGKRGEFDIKKAGQKQ